MSHDASNLTADHVKSLSNLKRLSLFCKPGDDNSVPQLIGRLRELLHNTIVRLEFEEVDRVGLREISEKFHLLSSSEISALQLSRCAFNIHLSEGFASGVSQLAYLKTLNLSHNNIESEITHIAVALIWRDLIFHIIRSNPRSRRFILAFEHLVRLKHLSLSHNNIGPRCVHHLAVKVSLLINLVSISISHNCIDVLAAKHITKELLRCRNIKSVNVGLRKVISTTAEYSNYVSGLKELSERNNKFEWYGRKEASAEPNRSCSYPVIAFMFIFFIILLFLLICGSIFDTDEDL